MFNLTSINSSNYPQISYPEDQFLQGLLASDNESHVIQFLIDHKVDLDNTLVPYMNMQVKLIHYFAAKGWNDGLKFLLEKGCQADECIQECTPLFFCCLQNNLKVASKSASLLLDYGANPSQPLPLIFYEKMEEMVKPGLENKNFNTKDFMHIFPNAISSFIAAVPSPEWSDLLSRKEIEPTLALLRLCFIINNLGGFVNLLNRFKGNINADENTDFGILQLVCTSIQPSVAEPFLEALLRTQGINLKHLSESGFPPVYYWIYKEDSDKFESSITKTYLSASDGFVEMVALQTLLLNRFNSSIYTKVGDQLIKFSTGFAPFSYREISSSLKQFLGGCLELSPDIKNLLLSVQWPEQKPSPSFDSLIEEIHHGAIAPLHTGWKGEKDDAGHAVEAVICKKDSQLFLLLSNRGEGSGQNPGIAIYEITEQEKLKELIELLKERSQKTKSFLIDEIQNSKFLKKVSFLKHKDQKMGNCAWLSPKTNVRAVMLAAYLAAGETLEDASKASFQLYKQWALFDRVQYGWERYLSHPYCQKPREQREAEGILVDRTVQECLMHAPLNLKESIMHQIFSRLDPNECKENLSELHRALLKGDESAALEMIKNGASIPQGTGNCYSVLHLAAWAGCKNVVKLLLEKGFCSKQMDKILLSPALLALKKGHVEIAKMLLPHTSDLNVRRLD